MTVGNVAEALAVTPVTAGRLVERFESAGWLDEITGYRRNRVFRYAPYLALFDVDRTGPDEGPSERTQAEAS